MHVCIYLIDVQNQKLIIVYIHIYRNSTLQRIILQKSSEWTPKKSKKKIRAETENSEDSGEVLMCIFVRIIIYNRMYMMHMNVCIH